MSSSQKIAILFLDTDKHVSPFEPLMAIDLFPDATIMLYSNVEPEDAKRIVQDAMFPRGPKGIRYTKMFIGGYDFEKVEKIVEVVKQTMFPPFEFAVIVDPRGANTTAAAAVAKMLQLSVKHGMDGFRGKRVAVLAGTGPVGIVASILFGLEGAEIIITSRNLERAQLTAQRVNMEIGSEKAVGVKASTPDEIGRVVEEADFVLATGAAGVRLLQLELLRSCSRGGVKIVADVNAVPPTGIEGLNPNDEDREIVAGVRGVGALRIGLLKNRVLAELFKRAIESPKGIFDYRASYEIAKQLAIEK
ncbi:MAG: methylene-tetrahydromethanopterin dehydrogenase N-terminal domain-containing protein [Ignisphaera sp.]